MNERIQKLAQQAAEATRIKHSNAYWQMMDEMPEDSDWRKKFAELIARECNECVRDVLRDENSSLGYEAAGEVQRYIKQHFGIEE